PTEVEAASGVARARVPVAGRRGEDEQQPRVAASAHLVALARVEDREEARAAGHRIAGAAMALDLALDDDELRALVDLVVLEQLARGQVQGDGARLAAHRVQDDRAVRPDVDAAQVPVLHGAMLQRPAAPVRVRAPRYSASPAGARRASASATSSIVVPRFPSAATSSLKSCGLDAACSACSIVTRPAFRCSN